jgi:transposase
MLQKNLSETEIQQLNYERYYYPCPMVQKRMEAVYITYTADLTQEMAGQICGLHRNMVRHWVRRYEAEGIEALYENNYGTNRSKLDHYAESILDFFKRQPPMNSNEAKVRIEEMTGINRSPSQIRVFMKRHGLRYIKTGHVPAKADVEKQRKWIIETLDPAIEEARKGECHLLFMDAAHFILQPFLCALWCVARLFVKASSGRNRINVLGAVNALSKEVITLSNTTYITAETIVDFLKQLRLHYGSIPLKIVLDNARYQHCRLVREQAEQMNITLLFLPSYSPNLNIIERLWKFTKKKILYGRYYASPDLFHHAVTGFFKTINKKYHPELKNLLTLKFQFFENQNALIYPV